MQPQLGIMEGAEFFQNVQVRFGQRRHMPQQHGDGGPTEHFHMPQRLRFAQAAEHVGQTLHDRLQGLYQYRAIVNGDDVLAGHGAETDCQMFRLGVPTHGHTGAATVAEFRPT
ncbi:hypothetical protein PS720_06432 [Pseudomonas fluorescens]|nr:hypothetical protein PS720_06432 [Pseudomonas fluorescens]